MNQDVQIFVLILPLLLAWWCVVLFVVAVNSGWRKLAQRYRQTDDVSGDTWRFQSATMRRWSGYGSCLSFTANPAGLRIAMLPFPVFHPSLFIPWSDVLVEEKRHLFLFRKVRLTFPAEPGIWIEISRRLAEKIQTAIGYDWFPADEGD